MVYRQVFTHGGGLLVAVPTPQIWISKEYRFYRHDDINRFMWFTLQPKSATEIGCWIEKYKTKTYQVEDEIR